jgi:hypothetical protein
MSAPRFVKIDSKRHLWRDLLQLRRGQKKGIGQALQPTLFELKEDHRPFAERTAAGRYREPSLLSD